MHDGGDVALLLLLSGTVESIGSAFSFCWGGLSLLVSMPPFLSAGHSVVIAAVSSVMVRSL